MRQTVTGLPLFCLAHGKSGRCCYPQYVFDALKEKGDMSLKTDFAYGENNYSFTIPAESGCMNLEQADFYGFMYLLGAFNGSIVE